AVTGAGVLVESLAERQVLSLCLSRKSCRVGGNKCEWSFLVLAVFRKVEVHASNQVPGRMTAFEKLLHAELGFSQFGIESRIDASPKMSKASRRRVLCPGHGGNGCALPV